MEKIIILGFNHALCNSVRLWQHAGAPCLPLPDPVPQPPGGSATPCPPPLRARQHSHPTPSATRSQCSHNLAADSTAPSQDPMQKCWCANSPAAKANTSSPHLPAVPQHTLKTLFWDMGIPRTTLQLPQPGAQRDCNNSGTQSPPHNTRWQPGRTQRFNGAIPVVQCTKYEQKGGGPQQGSYKKNSHVASRKIKIQG